MVLNVAQMNLGVSHKSFTGVGRNNLDTLQLWILDVPVSKKNVFNIECLVKNDSHYDFRIFFQCLPTFLFNEFQQSFAPRAHNLYPQGLLSIRERLHKLIRHEACVQQFNWKGGNT